MSLENTSTRAVYYYTPSNTTDQFEFKQKITASDGAPQDVFGYSARIAVDGNTMLVGSMGKSVYVFVKENNIWTEVEKIDAPTGNSNFAYNIGLSGKTAIVSSSYNTYSYFLEDC
jgi:hypothetical protein